MHKRVFRVWSSDVVCWYAIILKSIKVEAQSVRLSSQALATTKKELVNKKEKYQQLMIRTNSHKIEPRILMQNVVFVIIIHMFPGTVLVFNYFELVLDCEITA